ncbi:protein lethal(2)denticleless-like [Pollicipes pollicipes]|uniref:protein lethal(2)denticleless-like n=1 Tax=Pollicipes pollicipes TaxID=41117 RepID=UPI0018859126|nr:protein lethal(2)denticleless-like [Pollicipes pollicipes]
MMRRPPGPLPLLSCHSRDVLETAAADASAGQPDSYCCRFCPRPGATHLLASADEDGAIKLWDTRPAADVALTQCVAAHTNAVYELDWSADGRHLLSAAGDRAIKLWDSERLTLLAEFRRHSRTVKTVTFLPEDPCVFASGGRDGVVEVWDLRVAKQVSHEIRPRPTNKTGGRGRSAASMAPASVTSLVFRDDTYLLSATSGDSAVSVWDLRKHYSGGSGSRQPLPLCQLIGRQPERGVVCMAADRPLAQLYVSRIQDDIQRYSMTSWTADTDVSFSGHACGSFYVRCCLSADGSQLVSGSSDRHAYLWSAAAPGPPLARLPGHADEVTCVAWSSDGRTLATVCDDLRLRLWRADVTPPTEDGDSLLMEAMSGAPRAPLPLYTLGPVNDPRAPAAAEYRSPTANLPNWVADGVSPHRPVAARPQRTPRADWLTCLSQKKRAQVNCKTRPDTLTLPGSAGSRRHQGRADKPRPADRRATLLRRGEGACTKARALLSSASDVCPAAVPDHSPQSLV